MILLVERAIEKGTEGESGKTWQWRMLSAAGASWSSWPMPCADAQSHSCPRKAAGISARDERAKSLIEGQKPRSTVITAIAKGVVAGREASCQLSVS